MKILSAEQIDLNDEALKHIREWLEVMSQEPNDWMRMSEVYHSLRRMIGDE